MTLRAVFQPLPQAPLDTVVSRDQTTVLGWQLAGGGRRLLAGSSNYEDGLATGSSVRNST